jgi:hypothetical protein
MIKQILVGAILLASAAFIGPACAKGGSVAVHGYVRSNGTYVAPHVRTAPDSTRYNNWSSKPNVNPYSGKAGTIDPTKPKAP